MDEDHRERRRTRADYERGLPDYHDPTAGFGGAAPTYSALTLRIVLAAVGVVVGIAGAVLFAVNDVPVLAVLLGLFALGMAVDLGWVIHRKRRGEPG
jgi:hypothetical protein